MTTLTAPRRIAYAQQGGRPVAPVHYQHLKLIQTWQSVDLQATIDTIKPLGYTGILSKALDGRMWMSQVDPAADALGSLDEVRYQAELCHANGLYFFVWTNPLYGPDMALQATLSGQAARVCDGLFLDVEPYGQFWGAGNPVGAARDFMRWVRLEAPSAFIVLQPDPRPARLLEIRVAEWMEYCDALAGQHYWSDFGTAPRTELAYARDLSDVYGKPVLPTLPGNAPLAGFPMDAIAGFPGFVVWRWGSTPDATLAALGRARIAGLASARLRRP